MREYFKSVTSSAVVLGPTRRRFLAALGSGALALTAWQPAPALADPPGDGVPLDASPAAPTDRPGYEQRPEVKAFIAQMVRKHGFDRDALLTIFSQANHNDAVARLMGPAAVTTVTPWSDYEAHFIQSERIDAGVLFWQSHADDIGRATQVYGVPPEVILGILGVETYFGRNTGNFRVLDTLTTLSFDYPDPTRDRSAFFRGQLENFLVLARERSEDILGIRGSYAGAIGLPQFMPESILKYAVDFDGDGHIDLAASASDAIGSVANYLAQHGWITGLPIYYRTQLTNPHPDSLVIDRLVAAGSEPSWTPSDIRQAGFTSIDPVPADRLVSLINFPDGENPTRYVLGTQNFFVLTRYNRSYSYGMAVVELGVAIAAQRQNAKPTIPLSREDAR